MQNVYLFGNPVNSGQRAAFRLLALSKKMRRIMKITAFFLLVACLQVSARSSGQGITMSIKNAPLESIFHEIKIQSGYSFVYNNSLLKDADKIDLNVINASIDEVLRKCLDGQPFSYSIIETTVIIQPKRESDKVEDVKSIPEIKPVSFLEVRGKIVDENGEPVEGASVRVKGGTTGTSTNADGDFQLPGVDEKAVLVISGVNIVTFEVKVDGRIDLKTIRAKTKVATSQEIQIVGTGYSKFRKEAFTGNAITISKDQILKVSNKNVVSALQVFDPSLRLTVNNLMGSDPNTIPTFYIRGQSGIGIKELDKSDISQAALTNNPNLPVFIMDGFEVSLQKVYDYDPNRIKTITILKDAAATAIYGSRAANGVIVIETVSPAPGQLRASYNFVSSLSLPDLSGYNLMNAREKLDAEILTGIYDLNAPGLTGNARTQLNDELIQKEAQIMRGVNTDWIAQPLRNGFNQKHALYVDGGSQDIRFGFLMNYSLQEGVMKGSERELMGTGLTLEYRRKKVQVRNDFTYDRTNATNSPYGDFASYSIKAPYDAMVDVNGNLVKNTKVWHSGGTDQLNLVNPLYEVYNTKNSSTSKINGLTNNLSVNWYILPQLQLKGQLAVSQNTTLNEVFIDPNSGRYNINIYTNYDDIGSLTLTNVSRFAWNSNLFANYVNTIGNHNMNFSVGFNSNANVSRSDAQVYTGFPSGSKKSPNFASKIATRPTFSDNSTRLFGSFAALNYSYKDLYLFDASGRIDGSSEFGAERKYAPFWSFGAGVNLHKYGFLKDNSIFSKVKLTANLGQLGKVNFPPYAAIDNYVIAQGWYRSGAGASLIYMGNPYLNWEKTNTLDLVLDLGLFKDRLLINVDVYDKITNDLVNDVSLPLSAGFPGYKDNIGKIQNKGFEIFVRGDIVRSKDVIIGLYGNFAHNKNILLSISESLKSYNDKVNAEYQDYNVNTGKNYLNGPRYSTPHIKYVEGGSVTSIFGMRSLGINPIDGKEIYVKRDGTITTEWNALEQVIIGDASPKGQGAFGINASYKGFTLFASMLYQYGAQQYNATLVSKVENVDIYNRNTDKRVLTERWQNPGDISTLKDIKDRYYITLPTSRFMQNYNAIEFNSISIGYTLNEQLLKKLHASMLKVQLSTNNLGTISTVRQERGLTYPFARTFDLSVNLGF